MAAIAVRFAQAQDFEFVRDLRRKAGLVYAKAESEIFVNEEMCDKEDFSRSVPGRFIFIAKAGDACAGACTCTVVSTKRLPGLRSRKLCRINDIAVAEEYRRQGVGTALYEAVRRKVRECRCDAIQLIVWTFNEGAAAFYESLNMRRVSRCFA